jgi:hypothetical protein
LTCTTARTTTVITAALEATNFQEQLVELYGSSPSEKTFDDWHTARVGELSKALTGQVTKPEQITYGRIAKIIAIYIKTVYVSQAPHAALSKVAHPPIDGILLKEVKEKNPGHKYPPKLGSRWSTFDKEKYQQALGYLRKVNGDKAFWEIEVFWKAAVPKPKMP